MTIAIEGLQLYAYHGCYPQEREKGGRYQIDIYLKTNKLQGAKTDNLADTINYETIINIATTEMQQAANLIEHVAQRIAQQLSQTLSQLNSTQTNYHIKTIKVRLSKLDIPIGIPLTRTYVTYKIKL